MLLILWVVKRSDDDCLSPSSRGRDGACDGAALHVVFDEME